MAHILVERAVMILSLAEKTLTRLTECYTIRRCWARTLRSSRVQCSVHGIGSHPVPEFPVYMYVHVCTCTCTYIRHKYRLPRQQQDPPSVDEETVPGSLVSDRFPGISRSRAAATNKLCGARKLPRGVVNQLSYLRAPHHVGPCSSI